MEENLQELARRYMQERIAEIQYQLVLNEASGDKTGGFFGAWDLEEELLEELAELEYALLRGSFEPYVSWACRSSW